MREIPLTVLQYLKCTTDRNCFVCTIILTEGQLPQFEKYHILVNLLQFRHSGVWSLNEPVMNWLCFRQVKWTNRTSFVFLLFFVVDVTVFHLIDAPILKLFFNVMLILKISFYYSWLIVCWPTYQFLKMTNIIILLAIVILGQAKNYL